MPRVGVGVILNKEFDQKNVSEGGRSVRKKMKQKLEVKEVMVNIVCGYGLPVGCERLEKESFLREVDERIQSREL